MTKGLHKLASKEYTYKSHKVEIEVWLGRNDKFLKAKILDDNGRPAEFAFAEKRTRLIHKLPFVKEPEFDLENALKRL